jgi:hypothetical protein
VTRDRCCLPAKHAAGFCFFGRIGIGLYRVNTWNASLAFRWSDAGWTGPSRNNPGSLDHGDSVCRLSRRLEPTLSAVTAAVVGGVINLAVWFGLHVIFPSPGTIDWFAILVGLVAFTGLVRWKGDIARWIGRLVRLSLNLNQLIHLAAQCVFGFLRCRITEHDDLQSLLCEITFT